MSSLVKEAYRPDQSPKSFVPQIETQTQNDMRFEFPFSVRSLNNGMQFGRLLVDPPSDADRSWPHIRRPRMELGGEFRLYLFGMAVYSDL